MSTNSKYFDSLRLSRRRANKNKESHPTCYWQECDKEAPYKAPAGREREGQYLFFCLEHVREYNKNFNYFADLSQKDIDKLQIKARHGDRETWAQSTNPNARSTPHKAAPDFATIRSGSAAYYNRINRPYRCSPDNYSHAPQRVRKIKPLETRAFLSLGLPPTASAQEIKAKYKALLKTHHPDLNNGDRSSEQRFQEVLNAYNLLKKAGFC